jgi:hypothetical protein
MDLLNTENLVELHEKLNEFATYHKNKGGQEAHKLIKNELVDKVKSQPRDGSKEGLLIDKGYDRAIKQVLELLHKTFVP